MFGSIVVYLGALIAIAGAPLRSIKIALAGIAIFVIGMMLPARESRATPATSRLDEFMPVWQFSEFHQVKIAAPPARVFDAIRNVRADEITLFRTLTWIRRFGRKQSESILNAGKTKSLIDVATSTSFIMLADDEPRELVMGTAVIVPPGRHGKMRPALFHETLPPGFALATMNFRVTPDGAGSLVTTETRVYANSDSARRRFAGYWRIIYPGSSLIRYMWLRAVAKRSLVAGR